jgi:hypothetical protein
VFLFLLFATLVYFTHEPGDPAESCRADPVIVSGAQALERGLPVAIKLYSQLFDRLSIKDRSELFDRFPDCCEAYHPDLDPEGDGQLYWDARIRLPSPCSKRDVEITVRTDICGVQGGDWARFKTADNQGLATATDLCQ